MAGPWSVGLGVSDGCNNVQSLGHGETASVTAVGTEIHPHESPLRSETTAPRGLSGSAIAERSRSATMPLMARWTDWVPGLRASMSVLAGVLVLPAAGWSQEAAPPLERYRKLEFAPQAENFDKGWKNRVALEFEIINAADLQSLRAALEDKNAFVRSMAARALGILADKESAAALAELVKTDPEA